MHSAAKQFNLAHIIMATPMVESDSNTPIVTSTSESSGIESAYSGHADAGGVVTEKVDDAWKVSSMPEPKQYFSLDVSIALFVGIRM